MTVLAVLLTVLACVCVASWGWLWWRTRHGLLASRCRHKVIVTLKSGTAFSGVLTESDREAVVLRSSEFVKPGEGPIPVDGEVIVLRGDIDFLQRP